MAFVIASAFKPLIQRLVNMKIPKILSIITVYGVFIAFLTVAVILVIQPMAIEVSKLASVFPEYYTKISSMITNANSATNSNFAKEIQVGLGTFSNVLNQTVNSILSQTIKLFSGIFAFITILIMAFYFSTEENVIRKFLSNVIPEKHHRSIIEFNSKIEEKLGFWLRGQILLSLIIFSVTFVGLNLLGVQYALVLALLAGTFEIIPYFGPWFSGAVAVLLTLTQSPTKAILVAILYLVVQQLENSVIVPKVMGGSIGLNPLVVIIAILVGFKLGGVLGGLIAVPVAAALSVFVFEYLNKKDQEIKEII